MDDQCFIQAVTNFTRNFAYGDAIRHLVDKGYSVDRIIRDFQYPIPRDTIEKIADDHRIDLVTEHFHKNQEQIAYIKESGKDTVELWFLPQESWKEAHMDKVIRKRNLCSQNHNRLVSIVLSCSTEYKGEELVYLKLEELQNLIY